jgi:hypothetical protein
MLLDALFHVEKGLLAALEECSEIRLARNKVGIVNFSCSEVNSDPQLPSFMSLPPGYKCAPITYSKNVTLHEAIKEANQKDHKNWLSNLLALFHVYNLSNLQPLSQTLQKCTADMHTN